MRSVARQVNHEYMVLTDPVCAGCVNAHNSVIAAIRDEEGGKFVDYDIRRTTELKIVAPRSR
jgi:hypothetical protein